MRAVNVGIAARRVEIVVEGADVASVQLVAIVVVIAVLNVVMPAGAVNVEDVVISAGIAVTAVGVESALNVVRGAVIAVRGVAVSAVAV